MRNKYLDTFWNFNGSNTKEYTHGYHTYPAMMIPQIARELIKRYKTDKHKILFDPYIGSGTSLVEGKLAGFQCKGTDLNPLARLISETKVLNINSKTLKLYIKDYLEEIASKKNYFDDLKMFNIPEFSIKDTWFKEKNQKELSLIKDYIDCIEDTKIKMFFLVAFTETVRNVSLTRRGEFKLYRIPENKREEFNPCTFEVFRSKLISNEISLEHFKDALKINECSTKVEIHDFNTVEGIPTEIIKDESIDFVLTSPPYGDSSTTVAYGQFSRLANEWLGHEKAAKIDSKLMGGYKEKSEVILSSNILNDSLEEIEKVEINLKKENLSKNKKFTSRIPEVVAFYKDYQSSIKNVAKKIKTDGVAIYVVGNRRVRNIELPTDEITADFFENNGFKHIETIIREIPNKRLPKSTSPSNEKGKTVSTMNNEYIVVMKKI